MAQPQPEKRTTRRFALDLPIAVKFLDNGTFEVTGHTRDVSSRGVFFYLDSEIAEGRQYRVCDDVTFGDHLCWSNPCPLHRENSPCSQGREETRCCRCN